MIQEHAVASLQHRTCIVFSCGFDSVPGDIGAYLAAKALGSGQTGQVKTIYRVRDMLSGGTANSAMDLMALPAHVLGQLRTNAYILSPSGSARASERSRLTTHARRREGQRQTQDRPGDAHWWPLGRLFRNGASVLPSRSLMQ
jgi:short subunit dehydrogenase-like uncharacterized protein